MLDEFDIWNFLKKKVNTEDRRVAFKERDVFWCRFGTNIGYEMNGKGELFLRPVLVIKKFNSKVFLGMALSSKIKDFDRYYHQFEFKGKMQSIIINQVKLMDAKRLSHRMGAVMPDQFEEIKEKTRKMLLE